MNTKKVWIFAIIFGLIAAGLLSLMLKGQPTQSAEPASTTPAKEEEKKVDEDAEEPEEEKVFVNEIIPVTKGNRAITIEVNDAQGIAGFIDPGVFVDIVAVMSVPEENKDKQHDAATLLLQNVKVLAIGHAVDDEENRKRYQLVTIEVSPYEGLALGFATKHELYLMLRTEGDDKHEPDHTHIHEDDLHKGVFRKP